MARCLEKAVAGSVVALADSAVDLEVSGSVVARAVVGSGAEAAKAVDLAAAKAVADWVVVQL